MNYKIILKKIFQLFFLFILGVVQISFISSLPKPISYIHLPLLFIVISITILMQFHQALVLSLITGFMMGIISYQRFGIDILILLTISVFAHIIFNNIFTNVSIYSFVIIGIFSFILNYFMSWGLAWIYYALKIFPYSINDFFNVKIFFQYMSVNFALLFIAYIFYKKIHNTKLFKI